MHKHYVHRFELALDFSRVSHLPPMLPLGDFLSASLMSKASHLLWQTEVPGQVWESKSSLVKEEEEKMLKTSAGSP